MCRAGLSRMSPGGQQLLQSTAAKCSRNCAYRAAEKPQTAASRLGRRRPEWRKQTAPDDPAREPNRESSGQGALHRQDRRRPGLTGIKTGGASSGPMTKSCAMVSARRRTQITNLRTSGERRLADWARSARAKSSATMRFSAALSSLIANFQSITRPPIRSASIVWETRGGWTKYFWWSGCDPKNLARAAVDPGAADQILGG